MDSATFDGLRCHFQQLNDNLATILELKDAAQDDSCIDALVCLQSEIKGMQTTLNTFRVVLQKDRDQLDHVKGVNTYLKEKKGDLQHMVDNIPQRMPRPVHDRSGNCSEQKKANGICSEQKTTGNGNSSEQKTKPDMVSCNPMLDGPPQVPVGKQTNVYYPEVEFLTVDEFKSIPKYQKGRMTYDQINKFIEGMNKAYRSKYKLMKQKRSKMNNVNRKKYEDYKLQETKATSGCYFIVDEDLRVIGDLKMDSVARSILSILRHCGRCREVRGGQLTRYVYIDSY